MMKTLNRLSNCLFTVTFATGLMLASSAVSAKTSSEDIELMMEMIDVAELLKIYDKNGDQLLSAAEVTQGVQYEIQRSDSNRDGKINLSEFEPHWNNDMQRYIRREFSEVDLNNSQDISLAVLVHNYRALEKRWLIPICITQTSSDDELRKDATEELALLDNNRDQRLSYAEFSKTERQDMVADFKELDRNGDGQITSPEWQFSMKC